MLDYLILGMAAGKEQTGYEIKKRIENGIGVFYKASYGSLYPALKKLTGKGWLTLREEAQGCRQKIFYAATEKGRDVFMAWLTSPMQVLDGTNTHLAKVYFFDLLPTDVRRRQLLAYELNNEHYLHKLETLEKELRQREDGRRHYFKLSTLHYGICVTKETLRWCRHIADEKPLSEL